MRVTFPEPRFAVEHRPKGARRWATIAVVASRAVATAAMFDLMEVHEGDWAVRELPTSADTPTHTLAGSPARPQR